MGSHFVKPMCKFQRLNLTLNQNYFILLFISSEHPFLLWDILGHMCVD